MGSRTRGWLAIAAVVVVGLVLTFVVQERYHHRVLTLVFLWAAMGLAWNIISGYAGQTSFGHQAFFGIGGITMEQGLTEFNVDEAGTKRVMLERARQRIVVADHTKVGKVMLNTVASLTVVDKIITGSEVDGEIVTRLRQIGVEVILA